MTDSDIERTGLLKKGMVMNLLDCLDIILHEEAQATVDTPGNQYLNEAGLLKYEQFLGDLHFAPDELGGFWYLGDTLPVSFATMKKQDVLS